jgi:endonuclease-3 related protein
MKRKSKLSLIKCQANKQSGGVILRGLTGDRLMEMYHLMLNHFGPQHWWPAADALEMMVGAILTQNTSWKNVEKAIKNLKKRSILNIRALHSISVPELAEEIRPAGYFNIKAARLKNLIDFIVERYNGDVSMLLTEKTDILREGLLSIRGVGSETADSILLYAVGRPIFVIDSYTHRILNRHGLADDQASYHELQELFMDNLAEDTGLFNEFHALIVGIGKQYCRRKPLCGKCPLEKWGKRV